MVARHFILSGIQISEKTIFDEIRNRVEYLIKNLQSSDFPDWNIFEFLTKKEGHRGPSKQECIQYYNQKLVF